jgi:hypothetical protein
MFLLGKELVLNITSATKIYFGGRVAPNRKLAVGDAILAVIAVKTRVARQIDDLTL